MQNSALSGTFKSHPFPPELSDHCRKESRKTSTLELRWYPYWYPDPGTKMQELCLLQFGLTFPWISPDTHHSFLWRGMSVTLQSVILKIFFSLHGFTIKKVPHASGRDFEQCCQWLWLFPRHKWMHCEMTVSLWGPEYYGLNLKRPPQAPVFEYLACSW